MFPLLNWNTSNSNSKVIASGNPFQKFKRKGADLQLYIAMTLFVYKKGYIKCYILVTGYVNSKC